MRSRYWSCTKFADFVRGTKKLGSGTLEEWDEWKTIAKTNHPFRYWLAEEFLDKVQRFLNAPTDCIHSIRYWIINRFITRSHALTSSSLTRGQYHEMDQRILHSLFDELVNFVEVEKAWMQVISHSERYKKPSFFQRFKWRDANAGIEYLKWETTLTDVEWLDEDKKHEAKATPQALAAQEILELYFWWKFSRPNRVDPYELSGWSKLCEEKSLMEFSERRDPEHRKKTKEVLNRLNEIEESYEREDEEMLIRLIKIRRSLWT